MMAGYAVLIAPLALLAPWLGMATLDRETASFSAASPSAEAPVLESKAKRGMDPVASPQTLPAPSGPEQLKQRDRVRQIRIEKRVIVRITPRRSSNRQSLIAQLPQRAANTRYEERKASKCVPVQRIAAVETGSGNRLLLFMRDAKIISLNLEKACRARDFYSGFYVERNEDGKLCVERDRLQSRNGARCQIDRMAQLVAIRD
ncbi:MAG: hypothetical protein AAF127_03420 [Pseudomonadota bacterium]